MITFKYNGKIYKPSNLENKLKKLGITMEDIEIIDDTETKAEKERRENLEKTNTIELEETNLQIFWDTKCKGWYIVDLYNHNIKTNVYDDNRYKLIGYTNNNKLSDFTKEHYKEAIKL